MNLLSCLTYSILLLSYSKAMESPAADNSKAVNKREGTELTPSQPSKKRQKTYVLPNEESLVKMREQLEHKANILTRVLPQLKEDLKIIHKALKKTTHETFPSHPEKFPRASELSRYASGIKFMANSIEQWLYKLESRNYDKQNDLRGVSMAILASGTLPAKIDALIKFLSQSEETQDVDYKALTEAYQEIYKITEDLPNPVISKRK